MSRRGLRLGELLDPAHFTERLREVMEYHNHALQHYFKADTVDYQQVLDEVRRELAHQLIHEQGLDLKDLAHYLGFNDQSAFQHAFRRWEGMTPGQYRRRQEQSKRRD